ncbi:MAG: acylphosphatase [Calditrichia bacterium]
MKQFKARVEGLVQGVGYRYFVQRHANHLGLRGYVRNEMDGSVEVVAVGDEEKLKDLLKLLWQGPSFSSVVNVNVEWMEPETQYTNFKITY